MPMLIRASLQDRNGCPVLTLRPEGGLLAWQDWMCDAVSVFTLRPSGAPPSLALFSSRTGMLLAHFELPAPKMEALAAAHRYVLVCDELEGPWQTEGTIIKAEPVDPTGEFHQGIQCQAEGRLGEAIASYQRAVAASTGLPRIRSLMASCLRLVGRLEEAERAYQQEIERFPLLPEPFAGLGNLYLRTDRAQMARTMFEQALERDQFCLSALLSLSRLLAAQSGPASRLGATIRHRLLVAFASLPAVQEHLSDLAGAAGLSPQDFAVRVRAGAGLVTDPRLLKLMKRLESLRLNGAYLAAQQGFGHLLDRAAGSHLEGFFQHWVAKRKALFPPIFPGFLQPLIEEGDRRLQQRYPGLTRPLPPPDPAAGSPAALTREEFYELALEEILQDGQITPVEQTLLARLRHALRIDETTHQKLFAKAATFVSLPMADEGGDFTPARFLKKLALAILRDSQIDPQERTFLDLAREVLDLPPEALSTLLAEVNR